jgi:hypothetical protein
MDIACALSIVHIALVIADFVGNVSEEMLTCFSTRFPFLGLNFSDTDPGPPISVGLRYPPSVFRGIE